jgi:hypothetical protein
MNQMKLPGYCDHRVIEKEWRIVCAQRQARRALLRCAPGLQDDRES